MTNPKFFIEYIKTLGKIICSKRKNRLFWLKELSKLFIYNLASSLGMLIPKIKFLNYDIYTTKSCFGLILEIFYNNCYYFNLGEKEANHIIFDLGANIGIATLYFKYVYPNSKIYSFEPVPETFELLKKNVGNIKNVFIFPYAVGKQGKLNMTYSGVGDLDATAYLNYRKKNLTKNILVKSISLKNFIKKQGGTKIDLLKIDVEGLEDQVLTGLDFNKIRNIVVEWHLPLSKFNSISKKLNLKKYYRTEITDLGRFYLIRLSELK